MISEYNQGRRRLAARRRHEFIREWSVVKYFFMAVKKAEGEADFSKQFESRLLSSLELPVGQPRRLAARDAVFLAALSGGADSTAMAAALAAVLSGENFSGPAFSVHCVHINHNIRSAEEGRADEEAVAALCRRLSLPLIIRRLSPGEVEAWTRLHGTGLEAAARHFRHDLLQKEALRLGADAILIAHTRDDRLENTLMAVLRGSGPAGLGAFRPEAASGDPKNGKIPILRPLITSSRAAVLAYLAERGFSYRDDPSNTDTRFLRNKVRHTLIPFLDREFSHWRGPLLRFGETQAMAADFLAAEAGRRLPWEAEGGGFFMPACSFFAESPIIREEALFAAMDALASRPSFQVQSGADKPAPDAGFGAEAPELPPAAAFAPAPRPRRDALRPFVHGKQAACDAGAFRLEHKNGRICVRTAEGRTADFAGDGFFSVLIKKPGAYELEAAGLPPFACTPGRGRENECCRPAGKGPDWNEGAAFYAGLPLVLRTLSERAGFFEARDGEGRAALFDLRGALVWKRKEKAAFYCVFDGTPL